MESRHRRVWHHRMCGVWNRGGSSRAPTPTLCRRHKSRQRRGWHRAERVWNPDTVGYGITAYAVYGIEAGRRGRRPLRDKGTNRGKAQKDLTRTKAAGASPRPTLCRRHKSRQRRVWHRAERGWNPDPVGYGITAYAVYGIATGRRGRRPLRECVVKSHAARCAAYHAAKPHITRQVANITHRSAVHITKKEHPSVFLFPFHIHPFRFRSR